ncbi:metal-dependent hydrolase family protein [Actinokineospora sp. G85]|uniref:metal-dependent hydrolase family protein n=1 Tax=Actinokineospora sp. G85 TaxID=3406626 RepID=UPI003C70DF1E
MLTPQPLAVARSVKDAEAALAAGFTSLRDVGGHGCTLRETIAEGTVAGPRVYSANKVISQTAGHSDAHRLPHTWVSDPCRTGGMLHLADGVDECVRAVRLQLRAGAELIKVCASGGVFSEIDNPHHQQFLDRELAAIVEEATRADRAVAAHCHGRAGLLAAIRAGCRTIEHGTCVDQEIADLMVDNDITLVPTRTIYESMLTRLEALPPPWRPRFQSFADRHLDSLALAHATGVRIAAGTDIGLSTRGDSLSWGQNASEFVHLAAAGLTPLDVIAAGTANAPSTLGPLAPTSGQLKRGFDADILALHTNPLGDLSALGTPEAIAFVVKAGVDVRR